MGVNGEALQLHSAYTKAEFFTASHMRILISITSHVKINQYQVLQVTRTVSEHAMKLKVHMIKSLSP